MPCFLIFIRKSLLLMLCPRLRFLFLLLILLFRLRFFLLILTMCLHQCLPLILCLRPRCLFPFLTMAINTYLGDKYNGCFLLLLSLCFRLRFLTLFLRLKYLILLRLKYLILFLCLGYPILLRLKYLILFLRLRYLILLCLKYLILLLILLQCFLPLLSRFRIFDLVVPLCGLL